MTFGEMAKNDLKNVFFNIDEFAMEIAHTNSVDTVNEPLTVIFDKKTEVIMDAGSEYAESAALVPSFLIDDAKAEKINSHSSFLISNKLYGFAWKDEEDNDQTRVYLEAAK